MSKTHCKEYELCEWCGKKIIHPKAIKEEWGICYPCGNSETYVNKCVDCGDHYESNEETEDGICFDCELRIDVK